MKKMNSIKDLRRIQIKSCTKYAQNSKEPNDVFFIEYNSGDSFSSEGTIRYGEEQYVDNL